MYLVDTLPPPENLSLSDGVGHILINERGRQRRSRFGLRLPFISLCYRIEEKRKVCKRLQNVPRVFIARFASSSCDWWGHRKLYLTPGRNGGLGRAAPAICRRRAKLHAWSSSIIEVGLPWLRASIACGTHVRLRGLIRMTRGRHHSVLRASMAALGRREATIRNRSRTS